MPGGSIGRSGLRGSGKSTLIQSMCRTRPVGVEGGPSIGFTVSAPVRYDAREFVLYLFARLCQEVLGISPACPPRAERITQRPPWGTRYDWMTVVQLLLLVAGGYLVAIGAAGTRWQHAFGTTFRIIVGAVLLTAVLFIREVVRYAVTTTGRRSAVLTWRAGHAWVPVSDVSVHSRHVPAADFGTRLRIAEQALDWLDEIRYQLTYTSGWSGSLTVSVAQASASAARETAERQRTLPAIVAGYRGLVDEISRAGIRVFIGIDELDKIENEDDAQLFLNEIKSIFGSENCFYLVSISENAMSSFERRGLPFRDVFDSAFDEVVRIDLFTYSWKMISDFRDSHRLDVLPSPDPTWLDAIVNPAIPGDAISVP